MKISFVLAALAVLASVTAYSPYKHHHKSYKPAHKTYHKKAYHGHKPHHVYKPHHTYKPKHHYKGLTAASIESIPAEANIPFTSCGASADQVTLKGLALNPSTPSKSSPLTVTTYGDVVTAIVQGAKLNVSAFIAGTQVLSTAYDLCNASTACPITPGTDRAFSSTMPVPDELPPFVDIKIHAQAVNPDGTELFCLETTVNFAP